jgi:RNA polymerase sigma-70 factor, ECF subfamily
MTLTDLYAEHEEELRARAMRLSRDPQAADDLVQETFVRVLGHLPLLEQLAPYQRRAWLHQTLRNLFLDQRTARLRETAAVERLSREMTPWAEADDSVGDEGPFALLSGDDRRLAEMRYAQDMTSREIGEVLDVPAATVRWRLHQIIKRLRARGGQLT